MSEKIEKTEINYSLIVPAWNEEQFLPQCLEKLREAMSAQTQCGELIVVDNNSTDATASIGRKYGAEVVFEPHNNIACARNAGASRAQGEFLIFVDADTWVSSELLAETLRNLSTGDYFGGGAKLQLDAPLPSFARFMTKLWNRFAPRIGRASGCYIYCPKTLFEQVGRFPTKYYAGEELYLCRALQKAFPHLRFSWIDKFPVVSSARKMPDYSSPLFMLQMFLLGLFPFLLRYPQACSHWYRRNPL